jgi:hypothetical protein
VLSSWTIKPKARPIQANPTVPTTITALTWIFSTQDSTITNNTTLAIPVIVACLCYIFVGAFPPAELSNPLQKHGFILAEVRLSKALLLLLLLFSCCSVEAV